MFLLEIGWKEVGEELFSYFRFDDGILTRPLRLLGQHTISPIQGVVVVITGIFSSLQLKFHDLLFQLNAIDFGFIAWEVAGQSNKIIR